MNIYDLEDKYFLHEEFHGHSIFKNDFPDAYNELYKLLDSFELLKSEIITPGGRKSPIAQKFDDALYSIGWEEKQFRIEMNIDGSEVETPTHQIDYYKNRVGVELEWNNKDPFFDRDLNNFRLLHSIKALSVGVIVTRATELQEIFNELGKGSSYGASTTHINKLMPKIHGGGAGTCPLFIIGIKKSCYVEDV
ncbi:BglII/BstYI family type II restriction endonuclease [Bacteriovorax sp. DB6_IX]|uniref:BglII/BstYI family type II restriction endonuclease n=1 Tax=Bacteriovorax sp. DB6_IX TaxID=1353530 RepID=UPI00038A26B8|nr:BglII/BstYI family type II restriction endonuclease [Bacteriovorax sp. DB6_IX]EQC44450.1 restriction endonuclease BglII [Bacteriovorax sp. DB6_IX]